MNYLKIAKYALCLPVLFMTVLVSKSTLFPFIVGKYVFFRTVVGISFIAFLLGLLFDDVRAKAVFERMRKIIKTPIFIGISFFVIAFLLACFFGVDPSFSFWSNFERGEGGLQILNFYVYFFLLAVLFDKKEDWKVLFWCAVCGGVLMGLYGFLAISGANGFIGGGKISDPGYRFMGSIGNPAYVAVYSLFLIFYALYLFLQKRSGKLLSSRTFGFFLLIAFFFAVFLLAATRGAFIGLGVALVVSLLFLGFSYKKFRTKVISLALLFVLVVGVMVYFKNTPFVKSIPGSRIFDISFKAKTFEDRAIVWKMAWDGFKERPVFGWGPENFIQVFDKHFNTAYFKPAEGFGSWFDRAHSVIFDYLAETGIVGFLGYLSMFFGFYIMFFQFLKKQGGTGLSFFIIFERALIFAIPIGYLIQGLVLFDVSVTYLNLFTVLAFAASYFLIGTEQPQKAAHKNSKK